MTTFASYVEQTAIPKLEEGKTYVISGVATHDSIELQGEEVERVIFNLQDGTKLSALGMAVINQSKRFEKYFEEADNPDPITAMAMQVQGKAKTSKGHNKYWVLVDPVTKKAL